MHESGPRLTRADAQVTREPDAGRSGYRVARPPLTGQTLVVILEVVSALVRRATARHDVGQKPVTRGIAPPRPVSLLGIAA